MPHRFCVERKFPIFFGQINGHFHNVFLVDFVKTTQCQYLKLNSYESHDFAHKIKAQLTSMLSLGYSDVSFRFLTHSIVNLISFCNKS